MDSCCWVARETGAMNGMEIETFVGLLLLVGGVGMIVVSIVNMIRFRSKP